MELIFYWDGHITSMCSNDSYCIQKANAVQTLSHCVLKELLHDGEILKNLLNDVGWHYMFMLVSRRFEVMFFFEWNFLHMTRSFSAFIFVVF